ncbi:MAG: SMC family ATPase [Polyangiaceae bacterium]
MRPLKLKLSGLRSYREEQEVDFEDAGLVAILGDTGAGKSSLLEALTVALYGTSTWDAREIKQLISDGLNTMQVSLTFRAEGKVWRVERAVSRGTYPPARHTLERLEEGGERLDKKDAVDARIRQLVGLDYDAFLRSVVLPQGRFAALLTAKQAERANILKGILRLERLDQVREQAIDARQRMEPVERTLREERGKLLPDPVGAEAEAEERMAAAARQRDAAITTLGTVAQAREQGRLAAEKATRLSALVARAQQGRVEGAAAALGRLLERDREIEEALSETAGALLQKQAEEEELDSDLQAAEEKGAGPVSLASAKSGLTMIAEELPLVSADREALEKDDASIAKDAADIEKVEGMFATFREAADQAKAALGERKDEAKRAAERLKSAEKLLKDLRTARAEEAKAQKKAEKAASELEQARGAFSAAEEDSKKAESKLAEAESAAQAAAQKHAAHHASAGMKSGDPCPVCERELPAGWKAPRAPAVESAQKKVEKARADHDKAREKLASLRAKAESCQVRSSELSQELSERAEVSAKALVALAEVVKGATGDEDDTAILDGLHKAAEAAGGALAEAEKRAQETRDIFTRAETELKAAKGRLKERKGALAKAKEALSARKKRLTEAVGRLPSDLRPRLGDLGGKAGEKESSASDLAGLIARVDVRKAKIDEVVKRRDEARGARTVLEREKTRLADQRQREVAAKAGELDVQLATWGERLSLLAEALSAEPPSSRPEGAGLAEMAAWAGDFEQGAGALLARGETDLASAREEAARSEEAVRLALSAAGAESESELAGARDTAAGQHASAAADRDRARADKPRAAALDARIEQASGLSLALSEMVRLLADGKLIAHVVNRRQRVLLAVASELLGSMTRGRYGFSEDFEVVDNLSGQARGTRTLSGGETFLASLSLSLGLVELAGRAGGRLEALFLDEGFGSLDAGSLGEALDALTQKAEGGRLVAVISHLRAVAEMIDKVLVVRATPSGSKAEWVSAAEREKMLSEDVERGLLA